MDLVVVCGLNDNCSPVHKLHSEEDNDDERKLLNLIYSDCWKRRLRCFSMLFPLSVVVLFPIFLVHSTTFRVHQILNETAGTHFYGFAAAESQGHFPWAMRAFAFLYQLLHPGSGNFSSRIDAYLEGTVFIWMFKFLYPPIALAGCFPKVLNDSDTIEMIRGLQIGGEVFFRLALLRTTALLLAFVQESVPHRQRHFATSIFCAADALLNCLSYFIVEKLSDRNPSQKTLATLSFFLPFREFVVMIVLHHILHTISEKQRFDPPYYFINNYNAVLERGSAVIRADLAEWHELQTASFLFYWNVHLRAVRSEIFEHLIEEKCILPIKCRDHECDSSTLSHKVVAIQLLTSILLFPCLFLLRDLAEVFQQFGYSKESSKNFTELFYIGYATSSLLAIILPTFHSRFNTFFFSAVGSLSCLSVLTVLHYLYMTTATLYAGCLFYTLSLFFVINSVFLVPTAWTIIGEVTGKHRLSYLHIVVFFHIILWDLSDQIDKTYATTPVFCTIILLYTIVIGVFYCFHGVFRELTIQEDDELDIKLMCR